MHSGRRIRQFGVLAVFVLFATVLAAGVARAEDGDWPREIRTDKGVAVIYQPQLESYEKNVLKCRAAISVQPKGRSEPIFGTMWVTSTALVDRDTRMVTLDGITVTQTRFPGATKEQQKKVAAIVEAEIRKWDLSLSLDRLLAMMELLEKEQRATGKYASPVPKFLVSHEPAVLVTIDGEPILGKVGGAA